LTEKRRWVEQVGKPPEILSIAFNQEPVTANECVEQREDGSFSLVLGEQDEFNIDRLENALLQTSYPALRAGLSEHLGQAVKKACQVMTLAEAGSCLEEHSCPYRVKGEVGRFTFKTFDVKDTHQKPLFQGIELFPVAKGKQWYPTCGFKEIALIHGAAQRSYRQTVQVFNRSRRQENGGTPLNTLHDVAQAEGLKV